MSVARFLLCILGLCVAMGSSAQIIEPRTAVDKVFVESVKKRLSPCFTMLGAHRSIPVTTKRPPDKEMLAEVLLAASGPLVHDGYNYMLLIHGPSNAAYVVQFGGFAGSQAVFGPIALTATCE